MKESIVYGFLLSALMTGCGPEAIQVTSPDGSIRFILTQRNDSTMYDVLFNDRVVIAHSGLDLSFRDDEDFRWTSAGEVAYRDGVEDYHLMVGKTSHVQDPFSEASVPLRGTSQPHRRIDLVIRAFDDGVAFRYEFPEQQGWESFVLTEERTAFRFRGSPKVVALLLPDFKTSHEGLYSELGWDKVEEGHLVDLPALFEWDEGLYAAITEASLVDYAGMSIAREGDQFVTRLSPLPDDQDASVKAAIPHKSSWRVIMISDRVGDLIESNMITDLNEPCALSDTSWIKPGKTTWPWWNGNIVSDSSFTHGNNFETNKYYIDFCAANGLEYHSVVEYGGHEWYVSDGHDFQPGPHTDVTLPVPGLDMKQISDYAHSKGVDIRVWVHWAALVPKLDEALAKFEDWGISGMMVDFMDRDDQEMINIQETILKKAGTHHLHVQFHGVSKPTGLPRNYPNELTREGVMNYEYDKWDTVVTPDHDVIIPFTRMLAGPADYHLGGFRAARAPGFEIRYTAPLVRGTRSHMLAMYVVLESYLTMVADYPAAYDGQSGFDFIRKVPTTWDETRVVDGAVGKFSIIARRKGKDWYIGAITNHEARDIVVPLNFLQGGNYEMQLYADRIGADPNELDSMVQNVSKDDKIEIKLDEGGGAALCIREIR